MRVAVVVAVVVAAGGELRLPMDIPAVVEGVGPILLLSVPGVHRPMPVVLAVVVEPTPPRLVGNVREGTMTMKNHRQANYF